MFISPCTYFNEGLCRSCTWLDKSYPDQLQAKDQHLKQLLNNFPVENWLMPVASSNFAFRNKAKMVVSGTVDQPLLGILDDERRGVDLSRCPLYPDVFYPVFEYIKLFIRKAQLTPYHVERKKGELKYILLTRSRHQSSWMLRFVLRSGKCVNAIRDRLPWLQEQLPELLVVSVNIQPEHKAVLEGEQEIILTDEQAITESINGIPFYLSPRSFFQTNTDVATKLYATAREWTQSYSIHSVMDLFCGIGGFGLHCTPVSGTLLGVEIVSEAVHSARRSAEMIGLTQVAFSALDLNEKANAGVTKPDLLIVNPPRRGVGVAICQWINELQPEYLLYSSCNADTLAQDLSNIHGYKIKCIQLFDMFPNTAHYEVLILLQRC